ncbi:MAG: hypothetical protein IJ438_05390 [Clostridia bacterium]|nr:hypothetical protein [Clostridia bacterium]
MKKQSLLVLLLAMFLVLGGCAPSASNMTAEDRAIAMLSSAGVTVTAQAMEAARTQQEELAVLYARAGIEYDVDSDVELAHLALLHLGMGTFADDGSWTPSSSEVYAFDAEVFDIENMYALFLQGVQAIVPEVTIAEVQEDLSGMRTGTPLAGLLGLSWDEGTRRVSFLCNGHPYEKELTNYGDWFDAAMIDYMNEVLLAEGCEHRLHVVSSDYDQLVILIYGTQKQAHMLRVLLGAV